MPGLSTATRSISTTPPGQRGKGWVLTGVGAIPYYRTTNPILVADKISAIKALLEAST